MMLIESSGGTSIQEAFNLKKQLSDAADILGVINSNLPATADFYDRLVKDFNAMETAVTAIALKFGGNRELANEIKQTINGATASVVALGGSLDDVVKIQEGVIKGLSTQTILDKEAFKDIYAIGNLIGDGTKTSAESTKKLVEEFSNAGIGIYQMTKDMGGLITTARQMGVATSAVYSQLSANMNKLNLYNFDNGVQGMAKMAAQAAGLRIDMSKTLDLAEKLFNPEDAIQMSAKLQAMGVEVSNLLDPYKLMDMARNDPAELQSSIIEMTKSLTYFDEKNQKMAILPGAQGQLREIASALGMTSSELAKMAVNAGDLDRKMSEIRFNGNFASEEDKMMVAHMAQLGKEGTEFEGKYVVQLDDGTGNVITKAVDQLTDTDKKRIQKMEEEAKKDPTQLQRDANNILTNIANNTNALKGVAPRAIASSASFNTIQNRIGQTVEPLQKAAGETFGVKFGENGMVDVTVATNNMRDAGSKLVDLMVETMSHETDLSTAYAKIAEKAKEGFTALSDAVKKIPVLATEYSKKAGTPIDYSEYANAIADAIKGKINAMASSSLGLPSVKSLPLNTNLTNLSNTNLNTNVNNTNVNNNNNVNNASSVSVNGIIEHKFPDNLQNIWNMALNDPNWMSTLQKKLSEINSNNNALMGTGR